MTSVTTSTQLPETRKLKVTTVKRSDKSDPVLIDEAQFFEWIDALRSGNFSKTTGQLQGEDGFCCLGVACELFVPKTKRILNSEGYLNGGLPDMQLAAPMWLRVINQDINRRSKHDLAELNDKGVYPSPSAPYSDKVPGVHLARFTFEEIAEILEAVYVDEVLEPVDLDEKPEGTITGDFTVGEVAG